MVKLLPQITRLQRKPGIKLLNILSKILSPCGGIFCLLSLILIPLKEQLIETWRINQRMNQLVFNNTTDEGFNKTPGNRGSRTIFQQWVHIHNVRIQWLEICAKDIAADHSVLNKDMPFDTLLLYTEMEKSAGGISKLISRGWDNSGRISGFKKGVIPFVGYLISHESHHRGNMILTLKLAGEKIPDAVKWGLWEWGK